MIACLRAVAALLLALPAAAQWNPSAAQWGKDDPADVRILTWNVSDTVCSSNCKAQAPNDWTAVAVTLAALQPDVLVLQECGDNSGNGTGSGVDSVSNLSLTLSLLLHGGFDPFQGAAVGAWVQKYAPAFDLPFVFVSSSTDGFNRNAILSRWPFADLNGDGKATLSDFQMQADKYVPSSGGGGIRGYGVAEINLPDGAYAGDLVIGNSHLKAGSAGSDHDERVQAAQRIAYFIHHLYGGAGGTVPDPNGKILDTPAAATIASPTTPVISAGDWNENEDTNGTKGPAEWIIAAELMGDGGGDGTDRDTSDMTRDAATDWFTGNPNSIGNTKFDYIAWQDSLATLRRAVIFNSQTIPIGDQPPELAGFPASYTLVSSTASDHRAVFADLRLPAGLCNDAVDLGFGTPGTGGLVPRFTVCGTLDTGGSADFLLGQAKPRALVAAVVGLSTLHAPFAGGTLVPAPSVIFGGLVTDAAGALEVPGVPGGGGPFDLSIQWVVQDPAASAGKSLSNALKVGWLP